MREAGQKKKKEKRKGERAAPIREGGKEGKLTPVTNVLLGQDTLHSCSSRTFVPFPSTKQP